MKHRTAFRKVFSIFVASAWLLVGCSSMTEPAEERLNIRGEITQVITEGIGAAEFGALAEIMIEEDPSIPIEEWFSNPAGSRKIIYSVMPTTKIYEQIGEESPVEIGFEELTIGSTVRAWDTGFVVRTLPPRAYAEKIILVGAAP